MDAFLAALSGRLDLLTWTGLGLFLVLAVTLDWFVPRRAHLRMLNIQAEAHALAMKTQAESYAIVVESLTLRNVEITAEKNEWKGAAQASESVAQEVRSQNRTMLEQNATTVHALEGIRAGLVQGVQIINRDVTQ
jgi:hypothetical protein